MVEKEHFILRQSDPNSLIRPMLGMTHYDSISELELFFCETEKRDRTVEADKWRQLGTVDRRLLNVMTPLQWVGLERRPVCDKW